MSKSDLDKKNAKSVGEGNHKQSPDKDRKALRWMGFGIEFVGVLAIFSYGGWWADRKLGHQWPWLMVVGFGVAFIGMMYLLYKETSDLRK